MNTQRICYGFLLAALAAGPLNAAEPAKADSTVSPITPDGISVAVKVAPADGRPGPVLEGRDARVTLKITDKLSGQPLTNLYPGGWMDREDNAGRAAEARRRLPQKVNTFVAGALLSRPEMDFNVYYVLALNEDASISVVDPLFGYGSSKLLTMVFLKSPGEDWVLSPDAETGVRLHARGRPGRRRGHHELEGRGGDRDRAPPPRLAFQPDGQYLWVATDSGLSVIDAHALRKAADLPAGKGAHDLAFSDDSRFAFVSNETDGTVSVLDTGKLARLRDVRVGARPVSIAWSTQGKAAYVSTAGDGAVVVVDPLRPEPRARIAATPGSARSASRPAGASPSSSIPAPIPCTSWTRRATASSRPPTSRRSRTRCRSATSSPTSATAAAIRC